MVQGRRYKVQGSKTSTVPKPISVFGEKTSSPQSTIANPKALRLGLFGGAFNPIHLGHLRAATEIQEAFVFSLILFIPTAVPPHKGTWNLLPFAHRLKMVRLAIAGHPFLKASDIEKKRGGKSYSIRTLRYFKQPFGPMVELFFIIGIAAFLEINTWREYCNLFKLCHFVVMDRPGYHRNRIQEFLLREIDPDIIYFTKENRFLHPSGLSIYLFSITLMDISSTRIRRLRQINQSIRYLLPEPVEDYIIRRNFYVP